MESSENLPPGNRRNLQKQFSRQASCASYLMQAADLQDEQLDTNTKHVEEGLDDKFLEFCIEWSS